MPSYELTGTVKLVMDQQTFSSGFTKREFVVTTEGDRFPQDIKFECVKDKCALLDGVTPGQQVKVSFDLRGNEYNGRYFVNVNAWRLEPADQSGAPDTTVDDGPPLESLTPPGDAADEDVPPF